MKTFWIVLVVIAAVGAFVLFGGGGSAGGDASAVAGADAARSTPAAAEDAAVASFPEAAPATAPETAPESAPEPEAEPEAEPVTETASGSAPALADEALGGMPLGEGSRTVTEDAAGLGGLVFVPEPVPAATATEADREEGTMPNDAGSDAGSDPAAMEEAAAVLAGLLEAVGARAETIVSGATESIAAAPSAPRTEPVAASATAEAETVPEPEADLDAVLAELIGEDPVDSSDLPAEPAADAAPVDTVTAHPEGGLEIGGRWRVPGSGTAEDPYVMRWEVLQSAMRIYNPRLGQTELPAWAEAVDGKRVALEGYVVLPLAQQSSNEILLTLNQWDGCCIGVPPTPYDAIEVSLVTPIDGTAEIGAFYYGRIEGTFSVDPYLAGGWLLGLYLMEDAELAEFAMK